MANIDEIIAYADGSDIATLVTDGAIRTTYVNRAFTKLCGYSEEELLGKKPGDILRGPKSCEESRRSFRNGLRDLVPFEIRVKNYRKDSVENYIAGIYVVPVRDSSEPANTFFVGLQRELDSHTEEVLSDGNFSEALSSMVDLLTDVDS